MARSEKLKRLMFIKKHSLKKFEHALKTGQLVPTAYEMNVLYPRGKKRWIEMVMKKKLPKHLQKILDKNMKTDTGRRNLCKLVGGAYYRKKSGKIVKLRKKRDRKSVV